MKKIVTIFLAASLVVTLCINAAAFTPQTVKSLHPSFAENIFDISVDGAAIDKSSLLDITAYPGTILELVLTGEGENTDLFFDQNGLPINTADVTISKLRAARAFVSVMTSTGGIAVQNAELTVQNTGSPLSKPVISISFAKEFSGIEPIDFSFDIFINIDGSALPQSQISVSGTFGNQEMAVDAGVGSITPDGAVIVAEEYIPEIEIDAGYGIWVTASMRANDRYRISAASSSDYDDLEVISNDDRLIDVIALDSQGFYSGQIKSVRIEAEQNLYVYDEYGSFIGMTDSQLPPHPKYYLASRRMEV